MLKDMLDGLKSKVLGNEEREAERVVLKGDSASREMLSGERVRLVRENGFYSLKDAGGFPVYASMSVNIPQKTLDLLMDNNAEFEVRDYCDGSFRAVLTASESMFHHGTGKWITIS